ncbi:DUF3828 domain-containing protein [Pararhizobium sp. LjRoot255]|uniref:DUF3828 domain-containing protein n=1 Tax=Pararhizobium sp. LjRoot255 TaxID=3342298 RepID=UPI003ECD200B
MRLPTLALLFAALSALSALPAAAETFDTPQALLQALYRYDTTETDPDAPSLYSPFFSDQLNARFQADLDKTEPGDAGTIDFDPVISGNDGEATDIDVGQPIVIDDTAEVEVTFKNSVPVTLYYTLVKEHGGWKVDDIANQQGEYPWSLSALFDGAR